MKVANTRDVALDIVTAQPPPQAVAMWWLGQASVVLRAAGTTLYIDPFLSEYPDRLVPPLFPLPMLPLPITCSARTSMSIISTRRPCLAWRRYRLARASSFLCTWSSRSRRWVSLPGACWGRSRARCCTWEQSPCLPYPPPWTESSSCRLQLRFR